MSDDLIQEIDHDTAEPDAPDSDEQAADTADATPAAPKPPTVGQLRRERKRLWDERQETLYHVGGLALELHRRDLLADELIRKRTLIVEQMDVRLAEIDAQLSEIDDRRRRGRAREPEPAGYCLSCGAPHVDEAAFCFRCGARITTAVADADTQVISLPGGDV
jgi:hypothetical protein